MIMFDDFPSRLKRLRKEKHMSQHELGLEMEVSRSAVAGWESGKRSPSPLTLRKLALFFNVSSDYLCGRTPVRKNITTSSMTDLDITKLNPEGLRLLTELYKLIAANENYTA